MPGKVRVENEGAQYHAMDRGNRREAILGMVKTAVAPAFNE